MTIMKGWAILTHGKLAFSIDRPLVFRTKELANTHKYLSGDKVVRIEIRQPKNNNEVNDGRRKT